LPEAGHIAAGGPLLPAPAAEPPPPPHAATIAAIDRLQAHGAQKRETTRFIADLPGPAINIGLIEFVQQPDIDGARRRRYKSTPQRTGYARLRTRPRTQGGTGIAWNPSASLRP
jgi:hypothetical protein